MADKIEYMGHSLIQHGKINDRVYLMKTCRDDYPQILEQLCALAAARDYSKIFAKVPSWAKRGFERRGYKTEAHIPQFYHGTEDAFFMAKYLDSSRERVADTKLFDRIIDTAQSTKPLPPDAMRLDSGFRGGLMAPQDAREMAEVYKKVFETYPFPIHNPAYLADTMGKNIVYFGIRENEKLVAVSSCEMDEQAKNVEMSDFATLPKYRAKGLASHLLMRMEDAMRQRGMITAYTIARAESYGMNITFALHRYIFSGTLRNNTNIFGGIESMNVWYKTLLPQN